MVAGTNSTNEKDDKQFSHESSGADRLTAPSYCPDVHELYRVHLAVQRLLVAMRKVQERVKIGAETVQLDNMRLLHRYCHCICQEKASGKIV